MLVKLVIIENYCIFIVLKNNKELRTKIAIIIECKVIELFCMVDDFCNYFIVSKVTWMNVKFLNTDLCRIIEFVNGELKKWSIFYLSSQTVTFGSNHRILIIL